MSCHSLCAVLRSAGNTVLNIIVVLTVLYVETVFAQTADSDLRDSEVLQSVGAPLKLISQEQTTQSETFVPSADGVAQEGAGVVPGNATDQGEEGLNAQDLNDLDDAEFDALFDAAEDIEEDFIDLDSQEYVIPDEDGFVEYSDTTFTDEGLDTGQIEYVERSDDDLLIVEVVVDDAAVLDPGIIIYADEDGIVLPLSVMTQLFGFQIDVDPATGIAQGWFLDQENTFSLAPPYKVLGLKGENVNLSANSVENHFDDIFVKLDDFQRWFPVNVTLNYNELRLYVTTEEDLPFQVLANRRQRWDEARRQSRSPAGVNPEDLVKLPFRKYAPPLISVNNTVTVSENQGESQFNSTTTLQTQGDLFGLNLRTSGSYRTSSDGESQFQNFNFTFSKRDFEGNLLGPLKATQLEFGDVTTTSIPLAGSGGQGRGVVVNNQPINFVRSAANFVIDGFGPIGYDVEVYQDDRLLDFQTIGEDGTFSFETLNLRAGFNLFRVILYGPNGEREERFERFFLGRSAVKAGQFIYEVSALESSQPVFDPDNTGTPTPGTISVLGEYGLSDFASLNASVFQGPAADTILRGAGAGLRLSGRNSFGEINVFQTDTDARAFSASATGNITPTLSWSVDHLVNNNFDENVREIARETSVGLFKRFSLKRLSNASFSIEAAEAENEDGIITQEITNRVAGSFLGLNLVNEIDFIRQSNTEFDQVNGLLTLRKRLPLGIVRGRLNYSLDEISTGVDSLDLQWQNRFSPRFSINTTLSSVFGETPSNRLLTNFDWRFNKYQLGLNTSVSDNDEYSATLNLAYSFVPQTLSGNYRLTGQASDLSTGQVILVPFLDVNQNGIRDPGEDPIEGIEFINRLRGTRAVSNEIGQASLGGISPDIANRIEINEETLPDIYLVPQRKEFFVLGKLGVNGPVDYPLDKLGEISGVLYGIDPETGGAVPLENIEVFLLDEKEEVIAETITEFDGFYLFPSLPMGSYEMFFPKSTSLDAYYSGEGTGPRFTLTIDNPELTQEDIVVTDDRIGLRSSVRDTEFLLEKNLDEEERTDIQLQPKKKTGFFALKLRTFFDDEEER